MIPKITIVSMRNPLVKLPTLRIDRQTFLGNPFIIDKDGNRTEVIEKFQLYFDEKMLHDEDFKALFYEIANSYKHYKEIQLACWCEPGLCHGLIIKQALEEIYSDSK